MPVAKPVASTSQNSPAVAAPLAIVPTHSLQKELDQYNALLKSLQEFQKKYAPEASPKSVSLVDKLKGKKEGPGPLSYFEAQAKYFKNKNEAILKSHDADSEVHARKELKQHLEVLEQLNLLQQAARKQKANKPFLKAGVDAWLNSVNSAQQLFYNNRTSHRHYLYTDFNAVPVPMQIKLFANVIKHAVEAMKNPTLDTGKNLADASQVFADAVTGNRPAEVSNRMNPWLKGFLSALTTVAGLAMYIGGIVIGCSLAATGVGLAIGIPMIVVGAALFVGGFVNLLDALEGEPEAPAPRPATLEQTALKDSSIKAAKSLTTLANSTVSLFTANKAAEEAKKAEVEAKKAAELAKQKPSTAPQPTPPGGRATATA